MRVENDKYLIPTEKIFFFIRKKIIFPRVYFVNKWQQQKMFSFSITIDWLICQNMNYWLLQISTHKKKRKKTENNGNLYPFKYFYLCWHSYCLPWLIHNWSWTCLDSLIAFRRFLIKLYFHDFFFYFSLVLLFLLVVFAFRPHHRGISIMCSYLL